MTDTPTWWFDRCLGRALPNAMEALGVQVKRYADLYPDDPRTSGGHLCVPCGRTPSIRTESTFAGKCVA